MDHCYFAGSRIQSKGLDSNPGLAFLDGTRGLANEDQVLEIHGLVPHFGPNPRPPFSELQVTIRLF